MKKFLLVSLCITVLYLPTSFSASMTKEKTGATSANTQQVEANVKEAMKEFNSLSKKEKKSRFKEFKKALKKFKAEKKGGGDASTNTAVLVLLAILIPPLAVYLHEGATNSRFWISVLLTILGYVLFGFAGILFLGSLPGIIYSLIVVLGS